MAAAGIGKVRRNVWEKLTTKRLSARELLGSLRRSTALQSCSPLMPVDRRHERTWGNRLTDDQGRALSGHKTAQAYRGCAVCAIRHRQDDRRVDSNREDATTSTDIQFALRSNHRFSAFEAEVKQLELFCQFLNGKSVHRSRFRNPGLRGDWVTPRN